MSDSIVFQNRLLYLLFFRDSIGYFTSYRILYGTNILPYVSRDLRIFLQERLDRM